MSDEAECPLTDFTCFEHRCASLLFSLILIYSLPLVDDYSLAHCTCYMVQRLALCQWYLHRQSPRAHPQHPRWLNRHFYVCHQVASRARSMPSGHNAVGISLRLLRHSFYFYFYFEHLNFTWSYLIDTKISWSLDHIFWSYLDNLILAILSLDPWSYLLIYDLILISWLYHLMMIQDTFLYMNFTLLLTCIRHAFDSCL